MYFLLTVSCCNRDVSLFTENWTDDFTKYNCKETLDDIYVEWRSLLDHAIANFSESHEFLHVSILKRFNLKTKISHFDSTWLITCDNTDLW